MLRFPGACTSIPHTTIQSTENDPDEEERIRKVYSKLVHYYIGQWNTWLYLTMVSWHISTATGNTYVLPRYQSTGDCICLLSDLFWFVGASRRTRWPWREGAEKQHGRVQGRPPPRLGQPTQPELGPNRTLRHTARRVWRTHAVYGRAGVERGAPWRSIGEPRIWLEVLGKNVSFIFFGGCEFGRVEPSFCSWPPVPWGRCPLWLCPMWRLRQDAKGYHFVWSM